MILYVVPFFGTTYRMAPPANVDFANAYTRRPCSVPVDSCNVGAYFRKTRMPGPMRTNPERNRARTGVFLALAAYAWWGFIPLYFKLVTHVDVREVLVHRIVWTAASTAIVLMATGRLKTVASLLRQPARVAALALSAFCIGSNWLIFIWAVDHDRVLDTSLGYFINPLFMVMLGVFFFGERLRAAQSVAIALAAAAVTFLVWRHSGASLIALGLPLSFGMYSMIRKRIAVEAATGLLVESALLTPLALIYLAYWQGSGEMAFINGGTGTTLLLLLAGPVTTIPLLFFTASTRRIRLAVLGFLQYLTPSLSFLLATLLFREPFTTERLAVFLVIWSALVIFSVDAYRADRKARSPSPALPSKPNGQAP